MLNGYPPEYASQFYKIAFGSIDAGLFFCITGLAVIKSPDRDIEFRQP
jgi:hypothetical protein